MKKVTINRSDQEVKFARVFNYEEKQAKYKH